MLYAFFGFILGLVLGSFSLALADRSLEKKTFFGRSMCPNCKHKLAWFDLIPVFSYLWLNGKCRYCHKKIKTEYLVVEVIMGFAIGLVFWVSFLNYSDTVNLSQMVDFWFDLILKIFITTVLMIVAITDLKQTLIPDRITYPSFVVVLLSLIAISAFRIWNLFNTLNLNELGKFLIFKTDYFLIHSFWLSSPLWGGLITAFIVGLFFLILIIVTRGRGMGGGDLKLGIILGLYFGFPNALSSIMLAFFIGSIFAIGLILLRKKQFGQTIPFGPFLSLGAFLTLLYGQQIMDWYLQLKLT